MKGFAENGWKNVKGTIVTPGSRSAIEAGCKCPITDNCHGLGRPIGDGNVTFVVEAACPVHKDWPEAKVK